MTQEMSADQRYRPAGTEDLIGSQEPQEHRDPDQARLDEERMSGERTGEEDRDRDAVDDRDDQRISPQSLVPDNEGEQDAAILPDGRDSTPRDVVPQRDTLFDRDNVDGFRARWFELQAAFVDEPRSAVQQADELVAEVIQAMASMLSANKHELEGQWQGEGTADTEDLRQAMRQYRSFFDKLLHV